MDEKTVQDAPQLSALLSNPALLASLGGLFKSPSPPKEGASEAAPTDTPLSNGIGSLLSNPELMSKLPAVIAMLRPLTEGTPPTEGSAKAAHTEDHTKPESAAVPAIALSPTARDHAHCRNDLLLALKPFLSRERCEAIDLILKLSALGAVLKKLQ